MRFPHKNRLIIADDKGMSDKMVSRDAIRIRRHVHMHNFLSRCFIGRPVSLWGYC